MVLITCKECKAQVSDQAGKCPQCGAKAPKTTSRITLAVAGLVLIGVVRCSYNAATTAPPVAQKAAPAIPAASTESQCQSKMTSTLDAMRSAMKKGDPDTALAVINGCQRFLAKGGPMTLYASVVAAARKKQEKEMLADKARRKKEGVSLGMPQEEVLMSSWGKPERINVTTTASRRREQWVYGSGNYLYFEDGVLTSVQTRH